MATEPELPTIFVEPPQMGSVWANAFEVTLGRHEITLDFIRLDHSLEPAPGILVARVAMSDRLFDQLRSEFEVVWQAYAERSLPKEIHGSGEEA
jgi:hypothetical protein